MTPVRSVDGVGVPGGFKENIRHLREAKGWTETEAAAAADVPFRTLRNWEAGVREPRLDALKKLAATFKVSVDVLLADTLPDGGRPKKRTKNRD